MNAIIGLNHFCEVHGPIVLFSTQSIHETRNIQKLGNSVASNLSCSACSSIGSKMVLLSQDKESSIMFVSSEKSFKDAQAHLNIGAVKSLSSETSTSTHKEGLVYFGDARGHILCFTFALQDSMARGFFKLFSIIVLMKDKMFLLNTQPFLTKNLKEIAASLQKSAEKIYLSEQKSFSQRAERLNTGKLANSAPRSLQELTGESNVYAHLHSQFAWILWAGARYFTETLTLGNPSAPALFKDKDIEGFTFIQMDKEEFLMKKFPEQRCRDIQDASYDLRRLKTNTKSHFIQICYCILVGIQVVVRGPAEQCASIIRIFKELLPLESHRLIVENSPKCLSASKCKILSLSPEVPITQNMSNVFRVDFMDKTEVPITKWSGELPPKWPTLLTKIIKAVDEKMFTALILEKYIKALIEEWKNKVVCLSHTHSHEDSQKIKRSHGIQQQDELLINHWLSFL